MSSELTMALVAFAGTAFTAIMTKVMPKGTRENLIIDQLQEDRDKDRARLDDLAGRVGDLEAKVSSLRIRDGLWRIHVDRLGWHITQLGGTPEPIPAELMRSVDASD